MNTIAVCGVGRLGLPLALNFECSGDSEIIGFDIDRDYVEALNARTFDSAEPGVNDMLRSSGIRFTSDPGVLRQADLLVVCVRTDSLSSGAYDLQQLWDFVQIIQETWRKGERQTPVALAINCNVNPGTTRKISEILGPLGIEVYFWPEWVKQGSIVHDQTHPEVCVLGTRPGYQTAPRVLEIISRLDAENRIDKIHQLDLIDAELAKIALNCFLTVKISFANMMGNLLDQIGIDPAPVLRAVAGDSRVGQQFFKPGFGYGGPCLPRDNAALISFASSLGVEMPLCSAADRVNEQRHQILLMHALRNYHTTAENPELKSLSYKEGIPIFTESQQLRLAADLASVGIPVCIPDDASRELGIPLVSHGEYFLRKAVDNESVSAEGRNKV